MKQIILASASPSRQELLANLGLSFQIKISDVDESLDEQTPPVQQVEQLAERKARAVAAQLNQGLIIGADTLVVLNNKVLGKPADRREAIEMIRQLQGRSHEVYTGLAVIDVATDKTVVTHQATAVRFKPMTMEQIERYVDTGEPYDKAGAYAVQGKAAVFIDGIRGCYFNVVGLPVAKLADVLQMFGVQII